MSLLLLPLLAFVVVLSACGADPADATEVTIESPDGMASLTLSPASLPDGVSVGDIQLAWSAGESDEAGAPLAGVLLLPSGLELSQPATLQMTVPPDVEELLAVHVGADGFEFVAAVLASGKPVRPPRSRSSTSARLWCTALTSSW
jgi:hypothetical protein